MQVSVMEIGEALNNNTVLLVSEMGVERKQHRTPLVTLQLSYTLASASP
jgi:hypothetical protein